MDMDPYKRLGVPRSATPGEIHEAYRNLLRVYHPDIHRGDPSVASEETRALNEAYHTLKDPLRRREYDEGHPPPPKGKSRPKMETIPPPGRTRTAGGSTPAGHERPSQLVEDPLALTEEMMDDLDGWVHDPVCPVCGTESHALVAHCKSCASPLIPRSRSVSSETMDGWVHLSRCPSCKHRTDAIRPLCGNCGTRLPIQQSDFFGVKVPLALNTCRKCRYWVDPRTRRCLACGALLL